MDNRFIIPLNGLAAGENRFFWHVGKEFFDGFDNTEVLESQLDIEVVAEKSGRYIGIDCAVHGCVVVECDRCMEDLEMPVDVDIMLSVKFSDSGSSDEVSDNDREVIFVPADDTDLDLGQIVYDYVCTSLPMQRMHEDGECNPDALRYLGTKETSDVVSPSDGNPFSALKGMFE